jgi:hypothetical protein
MARTALSFSDRFGTLRRRRRACINDQQQEKNSKDLFTPYTVDLSPISTHSIYRQGYGIVIIL